MRGLAGTLHWEGSGIGAEAAGSGRLARGSRSPSWPGEEVAFEAAASLERGRVSVTSFRAATRSLEVAGSGSWRPGEGFSGRVAGTVGDLAQAASAGEVALGGSGRFAGDVAADAQGPRFTGVVHLRGHPRGAPGDRGQRPARRRPPAACSSPRAPWPGPAAAAASTARSSCPPGGSISWRLSSSSRSRRRRACSGPTRGSSRGRSRRGCGCAGRLGAPEVEGEVTGRALRYRTVAVDEGSLSLTYAARRLGVSRLRLRRGSTELTFHGALGEGREIEGEFESPAFDLADFAPLAGLRARRLAAREGARAAGRPAGRGRPARRAPALRGLRLQGRGARGRLPGRDGRRRGLGRGPGEPAARGRRAGQGLALRVRPRAAAVRPRTGPLGTRRLAAGAGPGSRQSLVPGHRAAPGQRAAARSRLGAGRPAAGHALAAGGREDAAEPRAGADLLARRGARGRGFPARRRTVPPVGPRRREPAPRGGTCRPTAP